MKIKISTIHAVLVYLLVFFSTTYISYNPIKYFLLVVVAMMIASNIKILSRNTYRGLNVGIALFCIATLIVSYINRNGYTDRNPFLAAIVFTATLVEFVLTVEMFCQREEMQNLIKVFYRMTLLVVIATDLLILFTTIHLQYGGNVFLVGTKFQVVYMHFYLISFFIADKNVRLRTVRESSLNNKSEIKKLSRQFLNVTFLISVPCCCGIILVADQIVEVLFGVEFLPAISTIRILSILIVLMPLSGGVFCQLLLTAGKEKSYLACVLIGTVVNAVLNYLLIPTFTQNGAAIASVVAEFTVSISMIVATRRTIKVNMCCRDVFSILTSAFVMSLTLVLCHKLFFGQAVWMRLLVEIVIAVLVYFLCVFMLKNSASSKIIRMIKK